MRVGLGFMFRNPPQWRRAFPQLYKEQLSDIRRAEELGFDSIWLSEHHFGEDGYSPSILPIAAAISAITTRIRIGTIVLLLPLHNAVRVAEDAATVDILSNGRFDLGVGQGYRKAEFEGYGVPLSERGLRFAEGLKVIRGLWDEETFSFKGKHYKINNASMMPKPVQNPMPLWIGGGAPKAIERVARLGCHFLGPGTLEGHHAFDAAVVANGGNPADFNSSHQRFCYVAPTRDQAWAEVQDHLHYSAKLYDRWLREAAEGFFPDSAARDYFPRPSDLRDNVDKLIGRPLVGTPEDVIAGVRRVLDTVRVTDLIFCLHHPGMDPKNSRDAMELFAREVLPHIR